MASPKTLKENARLKRIQQESLDRVAKERGLGPVPRTASRWIGRTKGLPYSRMIMFDFKVGENGLPGTLDLKHPTRNSGRRIRATPELLQVFMPVLPPNMQAAMLGAQ